MLKQKITTLLEAQSRKLKLLGIYIAFIFLAFMMVIPIIGRQVQKKADLGSAGVSSPSPGYQAEVKEKYPATPVLPAEKQEIQASPSPATDKESSKEPVTKETSTALKVEKSPAEPVIQQVAVNNMAWPLKGEIIREVGLSYSQTFSDYRYHEGIDIKGDRFAEVYPVLAGRVIKVENSRYEGKKVTVDHGGGWQSIYAHLEEIFCREGNTVKAGAALGQVGQPGLNEILEGPHLHFVLKKDGKVVNPLEYLPR